MRLTVQEHCGLVTVLVSNRVLCQFPEEQGGRFVFPWTVCPAWLSWGIGGSYNNVKTAEELLRLIHQFTDRVPEEKLLRNWKKLEWEYGPVVHEKMPELIELHATDFGPLPISPDVLNPDGSRKEAGWGWIEPHRRGEHAPGAVALWCPLCQLFNKDPIEYMRKMQSKTV